MSTVNSVESRAMKRAEEKASFWMHITIYIIVNTGLFLLNYFTEPGVWWFVFPLLGWGIFGVGGHFLTAFVLDEPYENLKEKIYKEEIKKLKAKGK